MTLKSLEDCAACSKVSHCNAHISGGTWDHRIGIDPCEIILTLEQQNKVWRRKMSKNHEKIRDTALADYVNICDSAWEDYKKIRDKEGDS